MADDRARLSRHLWETHYPGAARGWNLTLSYAEMLSRHLARFWERRYQAADAEFDRQHPPLPLRWENWREATEREKRKKEFLAPSMRNLDRARARTRDIICLEASRA